MRHLLVQKIVLHKQDAGMCSSGHFPVQTITFGTLSFFQRDEVDQCIIQVGVGNRLDQNRADA